MNAECSQMIAVDNHSNTSCSSERKSYNEIYVKSQEVSGKCAAIIKQMEDLRLNLSLALPHELRTPLNAILGFSHYLLSFTPEQLPEPEAILSMQTAIYESALRMQRLIENYLLYAKLRLMESAPEEREICQNDEAISTASLIASVALSKAKRAGRQEDLRIETVEANIRISEKGLQKIVEELIDNALKFSKPGTLIHIETQVNDQHWMCRITDHGRGMTSEQITSIGAYMQFERAWYAQQGSGLGLTIARLLTQLNSGDLTIESVPEQGTTVTLKLPDVQ